MTKQIKALRKATLYTHKESGKASQEAYVTLAPEPEGAAIDLIGEPKKISENHAKFEVRVKEGLVYLVEGVDFEFVN